MKDTNNLYAIVFMIIMNMMKIFMKHFMSKLSLLNMTISTLFTKYVILIICLNRIQVSVLADLNRQFVGKRFDWM